MKNEDEKKTIDRVKSVFVQFSKRKMGIRRLAVFFFKIFRIFSLEKKGEIQIFFLLKKNFFCLSFKFKSACPIQLLNILVHFFLFYIHIKLKYFC